MIDSAQLDELALEITASDETPTEWCARVGVELEAMSVLCNSAFEAATKALIDNERPLDAVIFETVGQTFRLAWLARERWEGQ